MDVLRLGVIVFGGLWIAFFLFLYLRARRKAAAAEAWPAVPGKVLSCEVKVAEGAGGDGGRTVFYVPLLTYSYNVGGLSLEGKRIGFGKTAHGSRAKAEADLAPYPVGSTPLVRYNPDRPSECVLETSKPGPAFLAVGAIGLVLILLVLLFPNLY
jgi:hypothetical protein